MFIFAAIFTIQQMLTDPKRALKKLRKKLFKK